MAIQSAVLRVNRVMALTLLRALETQLKTFEGDAGFSAVRAAEYADVIEAQRKLEQYAAERGWL